MTEDEEYDPEEIVDYDYDGADKLVTRLYSGTDEDYDPDILTRTIIQTLIDSGKKRLASPEFDKRVNYYWNVLRQEDDIYDQFLEIFEGQKDADLQASRNTYNMTVLAKMAVLSGLRYTSLLLRETGIFKGNPLRAYSEENMGKNWRAYVYTTPKQVPPGYKGDCKRYDHTKLYFACSMRKVSTIVINQQTHNISFAYDDIKDAEHKLRLLDDKLQEVIQAGISGEDLFPALMEQYYGRFAECSMKDGKILSGWVEEYEVPDVWWPKAFVLRTETGVRLIRAEELAMIKPVPAPKGSKSYKK